MRGTKPMPVYAEHVNGANPIAGSVFAHFFVAQHHQLVHVDQPLRPGILIVKHTNQVSRHDFSPIPITAWVLPGHFAMFLHGFSHQILLN
jgi:hypothetical protein